jgi:hypothetical protein
VYVELLVAKGLLDLPKECKAFALRGIARMLSKANANGLNEVPWHLRIPGFQIDKTSSQCRELGVALFWIRADCPAKLKLPFSGTHRNQNPCKLYSLVDLDQYMW